MLNQKISPGQATPTNHSRETALSNVVYCVRLAAHLYDMQTTIYVPPSTLIIDKCSFLSCFNNRQKLSVAYRKEEWPNNKAIIYRSIEKQHCQCHLLDSLGRPSLRDANTCFVSIINMNIFIFVICR